ncbi:hypothetical protein AB0E69_16525 [Kribbella sp. NPDC026611]|uniref:hypothetical protein n=1 Tax=Kribbella sp. NPDC026611 TaxID=3154911 RepID=UPI0033CD89EB
MRYLLEFVGGVTLIIVVMIVAGRHLRRPGSPKGPTWRNLAIGLALFVVASALNTLPPHDIVLSVLVLVLGVGFFALGVATLGGGNFSYYGAAACGMAAVPFFMLPTPIGLHLVGHTIQCRVRDYRGHAVTDFTADCPGRKSYDFHKHGLHTFPGGQVDVVVDPHGLLQAQYVGQEDLAKESVWGGLGLLGAAGVVAAAAYNRKRLHGEVKHVVKPPFSTGP